jgi:hypothetical protein
MCAGRLRFRTHLIAAILAALTTMTAACFQSAPSTGASAAKPGSVTELLSGPRIVVADNTVLRGDPSADAAPLELLQEGDVVQLVAASGDGIWYQVNAEPDGQVGWLLSDMVVEPVGAGRVMAAGLNVRAGPGMAYPVKTAVGQDARMDVLAQAFDCTWLRVVEPGGTLGWVAGRYLDFAAPCGAIPQAVHLPPLPPVPSSVTVPAASTTPTPRQGLLEAPQLVDPPDGAEYAEPGQVVLRWSTVKGQLAQDAYYIITINFWHAGQLWTDYAFTAQTEWSLANHSYLLDVADDDRFIWSVTLLRATGMSEDGVPTGDEISERSGVRQFAIMAGVPAEAKRHSEPGLGGGRQFVPPSTVPAPATPGANSVVVPAPQPPSIPQPAVPTPTDLVSGQENGTIVPGPTSPPVTPAP